MKQHGSKTGATSIILVLLFVAGRAQVAEPIGELRLYERATQIGTVASREFKDNKGRVVKVIYYTGGGSFEGPYREDLLREQSIHNYTYDDHDCRIKSESYSPGMKLSRTEEVHCLDGTATRSLTTVRDARGIKQAEIRHTANGGTQTELYFDSDGDKVVAINGEVPADVNLTHGWGELLNGFVCGIAANRERGRQEDLNVIVTIRNISHDMKGVVMISPVLVELKDNTGRVIERKPAYGIPKDDARSEGCPTYLSQGAPSAGRSQLQPGFTLGEQYDRLAPGKYSLTITYCVSAVSGLLVSNTILLEVEGRETR